MRRFLLVRHAESELGALGLVDGERDRANPLSAVGRAQAEELAARLAGEPVDLCVTTRFERTRETADLALARRGAPRLVVEELDEIGFGRWEETAVRGVRRLGVDAPARPSARRGTARAGRRSRRGSRPDGAGCSSGPSRPWSRSSTASPSATRSTPPAASCPAQRSEQVALAEPYELTEPELVTAVETLARWAQRPAWRTGAA